MTQSTIEEEAGTRPAAHAPVLLDLKTFPVFLRAGLLPEELGSFFTLLRELQEAEAMDHWMVMENIVGDLHDVIEAMQERLRLLHLQIGEVLK